MQAFLIFTLLLLLFDLYAFRAVKSLAQNWKSLGVKWIIYILFWFLPVLLLILTLLTYFRPVGPPAYFSKYYFLVGLLILFYIPKLLIAVFLLLDDILSLVSYFVVQPLRKNPPQVFQRYRLFTKTGFILSILPFVAILYGIIFGRFDFRIKEHTLAFRQLPDAFDGFRIVHISDIHTGSFYGHKKRLEKALELVSAADADLIVFTGDLVNNYAGELEGWDSSFKETGARYGKYAVLGNHDYGDYSRWNSPEEKQQNFEAIKKFLERTGFVLLNNAHAVLVLDNDSLAILGVENWGSPPFAQYGDLEAALDGIHNIAFKMLLSHDPVHWNAEVTGKTDIALTLSGHTHAMQFGIRLGRFKWSPSKYLFPYWSGLYQLEDQYLHVNQGLGFIGFPGRIGMPPEITVLILRKDSDR